MSTVAPAPPTTTPKAPQSPERRRVLTRWRRTDAYALGGALAVALCVAGMLFQNFSALSGWMGFAVVTYGVFLGIYGLLVSFDERGPAVRDRLAAAVMHSLAGLVVLALVLIISFPFVRGWEALQHLNFYTEDLSKAGPLDPLTKGGMLHAIVGTLEQIAIALAISVPLGLLCAVFLTEVPGRFSRLVRTVSEAMTALPSIVAGLFIYATAIIMLGLDKSGMAAALALTVMMLPIIIRAADVVLRLVPGTLKEAALATGASQWRTIWQVTLPTARSGLATAVILGTARGIGETSPVLLTAGYTTYLNANPTSGPQVSLPLATFNLIKSPEPTMVARGFGAAAILLVLVLVLFVIARIVGGRGPGQLSRRQQRRAARASHADAQRFAARTTRLITLPSGESS